MILCLKGSGSIRQRMSLVHHVVRSTNNNILTKKPFNFARPVTMTRTLLPQIHLQQRATMSTIPSLFESIGKENTTEEAKHLSPNEQLFASIDSLRPSKIIITEKTLGRLKQLLDHSYTVPQLKKYLGHHNVATTKNRKKANLIQCILEEHWKVTTPERKRAKELQERKNTSQQKFKLEKDELFFVLDNNGDVLRDIESTHNVRIMVNVSELIGTVEGQKRQLNSALVAIKKALTLERRSFKLTDAQSYSYLNLVSQRVLDDLSKSSGAYISFEDNVISLTAPNAEIVEDAKRKLAVFLTDFGLTSKRSLQSSDYTVIQNQPDSTLAAAPLTLLPLHDSSAMPSAMKAIGWSRLSGTEETMNESMIQSDISKFHMLTGTGSSSSDLDPKQLKDILQQSFRTIDENKCISLEATYGHLLFQNPTKTPEQANLLLPELPGSFDTKDLQKLLETSTSHRRFFSAKPPSRIRPSLVPITSKDDFHHRRVKIEYIDSSLIGQLVQSDNTFTPSTTSTLSNFKRLQLEFLEQSDGTLEFKRAIGEHSRSTLDILGLAGNVDVRLTAKEYTNIGDDTSLKESALPASLSKLVANCSLDGHCEASCPKAWNNESNDMVLLNVSFNNESRYQLDDNLVTLRYIEEQENKTSRTEMKIEPFNQGSTVNNGFGSWDDFWNKMTYLAQRWSYRPPLV